MNGEDLHKIIALAVEAAETNLWGFEYLPGNHKGLLRVYIDSPEGINIDDCERASHQLSAALNVHDPIKGEYDLEVSSPGVERPLFGFEQYAQYIGKKAKFLLQQAIQNKRRFRGTIKAVDAENKRVTVTAEDNSELTLSAADIVKVNLVFEFDGGKKHGK